MRTIVLSVLLAAAGCSASSNPSPTPEGDPLGTASQAALGFAGGPSAVEVDTRLVVFAEDFSRTLLHKIYSNGTWSDWMRITASPGSYVIGNPSPVVAG